MISQRIEWIDVAKGLSMLCIILSHIVMFQNPYVDTVRFYHVPIFVFLSGLFFNEKILCRQLISKYASRLLKPYYLYGFIIAIVWRFDFHSFLNYIQGKRFCSSLWFLTLLFSTIFIAYLLLKIHSKYKYIIATFFFIVCLFWNTLIHRTLPLNIDAAFYMVPFFMFANYYKERIISWNYSPKFSVVLFAVFMVYGYSSYSRNLTPNFFYLDYGILPITIIGTILGIYMICGFSQFISEHESYLKKYLSFVGKNSIVFLLMQQALFLNFFPYYSLFPGDGFCRFVLCNIYCSLWVFVINKWLKWTIQ